MCCSQQRSYFAPDTLSCIADGTGVCLCTDSRVGLVRSWSPRLQRLQIHAWSLWRALQASPADMALHTCKPDACPVMVLPTNLQLPPQARACHDCMHMSHRRSCVQLRISVLLKTEAGA